MHPRVEDHHDALVATRANQPADPLSKLQHRLGKLKVHERVAAGLADSLDPRFDHRLVRHGEGQADDDDVAPAFAVVARENDDTAADRVDRVAEVAVPATAPVPVFAEVTVRPESARFVIAVAVRFADGEIEAVRELVSLSNGKTPFIVRRVKEDARNNPESRAWESNLFRARSRHEPGKNNLP